MCWQANADGKIAWVLMTIWTCCACFKPKRWTLPLRILGKRREVFLLFPNLLQYNFVCFQSCFGYLLPRVCYQTTRLLPAYPCILDSEIRYIGNISGGGLVRIMEIHMCMAVEFPTRGRFSFTSIRVVLVLSSNDDWKLKLCRHPRQSTASRCSRLGSKFWDLWLEKQQISKHSWDPILLKFKSRSDNISLGTSSGELFCFHGDYPGISYCRAAFQSVMLFRGDDS